MSSSFPHYPLQHSHPSLQQSDVVLMVYPHQVHWKIVENRLLHLPHLHWQLTRQPCCRPDNIWIYDTEKRSRRGRSFFFFFFFWGGEKVRRCVGGRGGEVGKDHWVGKWGVALWHRIKWGVRSLAACRVRLPSNIKAYKNLLAEAYGGHSASKHPAMLFRLIMQSGMGGPEARMQPILLPFPWDAI